MHFGGPNPNHPRHHQREEDEVRELNRNLDRVTQEKKVLEDKIQEILSQESQLAHTNRILEKDVADLSKQVVILLGQVEVLQGKRKTHGTIDTFPLNSETLTHTQLTSFKDIEELQKVNLVLNRATQELSEKVKVDADEKQERIDYLESTLMKKAKTSIEQLKSALVSRNQIAKTLNAENEVLRDLAQVDPGSKLPQLEEILKSRAAAGKDACPLALIKRFEEQLVSEHEQYKSLQTEMGSLREASHRMKTDYEVRILELVAEGQALKEKLARESKTVEKLKSDLNSSSQQQMVLKSDAVSMKEKMNEILARNVRLETELGHVVQSQQSTKQFLEASQAEEVYLQDQLDKVEAQNAGLRKEHELLTKRILEDAATSSALHKTLRAELKQLKTERMELVTQIKELQDRILAQGARHEQGLHEYVCKLEDSTRDLSASRAAFEESQASLAEARAAKELAEKEVLRLSDLVAASSVGEAQVIKTYSAKLQSALDTIKELRGNENQYRAIAQAAEESLQNNIQKSNEVKIQLNQEIQKQKKLLQEAEKEAGLKLADAQERGAQSQAALEKLQAEKAQLTNELQTTQAQHESTQAYLKETQALVQQLEDKVAASESNVLSLDEAQMELQNHLKEVKEQSLLKENQAATQWATEREALVREMDNLGQTISELRLIIESLSSKTPDPKGLIAFLRQEKDRAEGGLQSCIINNKRLQAEIEVANAALDNTRRLLEPQDEVDQLRAALNDHELRLQQLSDTNRKLEAENLRLAQSKSHPTPATTDPLQSLDLELKDKEIAMLQETNHRNALQIQKLLEKPTTTKFLQLKDSNAALQVENDSLKAEIHQNKIDATTSQSQSKKDQAKLENLIKHYVKLGKNYKASTIKLMEETQAQKSLIATLQAALGLEGESPDALVRAVQLLKGDPTTHTGQNQNVQVVNVDGNEDEEVEDVDRVLEISPEPSLKRFRQSSPLVPVPTSTNTLLRSPALLPHSQDSNEKSDD